MKILAEKLLVEKRNKALEMAGKTIVKEYSYKAVSINKEKRTAVFVMSTNLKDRYEDMVDQDSWVLKYFIENSYFGWQHQTNDFPLGRWLNVWLEADPENEGKQRLVGEAYFTDIDERAERAWKHVLEGNIKMVSVGFIPGRVEYDEEKDAFILYDCELLECSLVGIGANRQALLKTNDKEDLKEIKETMIDAQNALDHKIKKIENIRVSNNLKALELLSKAIRQIK